MPTTVVPTQHSHRQTARREQTKDTLDIGDTPTFVIIVFVYRIRHLREERGWRQLLRVSYHNNLLSTCHRAQRIHRLYLTSRSEEHTSELQSLMRISYAVFCLKKKK